MRELLYTEAFYYLAIIILEAMTKFDQQWQQYIRIY